MVVERKKTGEDYLDEFKGLKGFSKNTEDGDTIYFKKVVYEDKARLLVASSARKEKEEAMDALKENRFIEDAGNLKRSVVKGNIILAPRSMSG